MIARSATTSCFANNVLLGGHVTVGDNVVFGGGVAVRQFVRIGEGAMIVGLSGVRADVIPWGMAQGPLADLVGLNVVGMRRRGVAEGRHPCACAQAYRRCFSATANSARGSSRSPPSMPAIALVDKIDRLHPRRQAAAHHGGQARRGRTRVA